MKNIFTAGLIFAFATNAIGQQQVKPFAGIYGGVGTYMLQGGIEAGAEKGRVGVMADVTRYHQGITSYAGKVAVKGIYFDTYENEHLSAVVGWSRYNVTDQGEKFKRQSVLLAIRWTYYNVVTDFGWKDDGIFFSVGWQLRKINR